MGQCSKCRFYRAIEDRENVGQCRRYPPELVIAKAQLVPVRGAKVNMAGQMRAAVEGFELASIGWRTDYRKVIADWDCGEWAHRGEN